MLLLLLQALFWPQLSVIILLSVPFSLSPFLSILLSHPPLSFSLDLDRHYVITSGLPPFKSQDADTVKLLCSLFEGGGGL